jgi:hypothetical protein
MRVAEVIKQATTIQDTLSGICDAEDAGPNLLRLAIITKQVAACLESAENLRDEVDDHLSNLSSETAIERWEQILQAVEELQDAATTCHDDLEAALGNRKVATHERLEEALALVNEFRDAADECLSNVESL